MLGFWYGYFDCENWWDSVMPQKIKIIGLVKTDEYIQKELDVVEASKLKLLRDSDWTQTMDCPLSTLDILKWRYWRFKVRSTQITEDSYEQAAETLQLLSKSTPKKTNSKLYKTIYTRLNFNTSDLLIESCIGILKEVFPNRKRPINHFIKRVEKCQDYDTIFKVFIGTLNGY